MHSTGVTITNPLVLYRSLLATQKIRPDPAQHRLALHLQKLYDQLIDYEPSLAYSQRLKQLNRVVNIDQNAPLPPTDRNGGRFGTRGVWASLLAQKDKRESLSLTKVLTSQEEAMQLQSPKGLMLHGEVGTGKSMLIDLFQECLPNRKKRRWHFNTFMLDTISRLEQLRRSRTLFNGTGAAEDEHSLLLVARDLIETSPILFLDEFQLPDRVASKILSNLMTSFFQLGGVLIATSNRMPEELAKAAGMEFSRPVSKVSRLGWSMRSKVTSRRDDGPGQLGEFSGFLDVLKARCEVWEMEGKKDYRKSETEEPNAKVEAVPLTSPDYISFGATATNLGITAPDPTQEGLAETTGTTSEAVLPKHYLIQPTTGEQMTTFAKAFNAIVEVATRHSYPIPWTPSTLTVYGRLISIPAQYNGVAFFTFSELCGAVLGPADYITLASTFHTFILTDVPVLGFLNKNEARRLITLLDALYEARCRLMITATTGPDTLFFPEPPASPTPASLDGSALGEQELLNDAVHPETYSEIYQDLNSPFRPNVSSYDSGALAADALEDDPPNRVRKPGTSYTDERRLGSRAPNFANIRGLTGEDEVFAVKRAESRIWEMCSRRWWERGSSVAETSKEAGIEEDAQPSAQSPDWWRPLPVSSRHWEQASIPEEPRGSVDRTGLPPNVKVLSESEVEADRKKDVEDMFAHGASPFRTHPDAPPKLSWTHVWGTTKWGKRAGAWGKGVEGLEERKSDKEKGREGFGEGGGRRAK
ncbi:hypothetical protein IQ07DRAFT_570322 [Pyrenochaeta sp. DS3sAY3a]|nr:hypothetical protein IQ07DRAFT_570322 [Pyrenochaeta sp. DS3sAY3a]